MANRNKQIINYDPVATPTETDLLLSQPAAGGIYATYTPAQLAAVIPPRGTSFPGSPSTGDIFYRTDLRAICYYDGARWVGDIITIPMASYESLARNMTDSTRPYATAVPNEDILLVRWDVAYWLVGDVDASNYWTYSLSRTINAGSEVEVVSQDVNTSLAQWRKDSHSLSTVIPSNDRVLRVYADKTGWPGPFSMMGVLFARRIYT